MAMMILGLLGGAVYSLSTAALETSKAVKASIRPVPGWMRF